MDHFERIAASAHAQEILRVWRDAEEGGDLSLEIDAAEGAFVALLITLLYRDAGPAGGRGSPPAPRGGAKGAGPAAKAAARGAKDALSAAPSSPSPSPQKFLAVTSTETEAAALAGDLQTAGAPAAVFPWWGTMPYRDFSTPATLQTVFGERVSILASLAGGAPGIVIAPERAFLTPLPPVDYMTGLLLPVKAGDVLDTATLTRRLGEYGYTRVPRVQMRGEFALRGEVLDVLMGDEAAWRVRFAFDRVESTRRFNPLDQTSIGKDDDEPLVIRPLKEVVWTDDRIEVLERNMERLGLFSGEGGKAGRLFLEELMARKGCPGEELAFPLAFDKPAALTDYLGPGGTVFFVDRERVRNGRDALEREYKSLYTTARRGFTALAKPQPLCMTPPEALLARDDGEYPRRVSFMSLKGGGEPGAVRLSAGCEPARSFFGNVDYLKEEFAALTQAGWSILVAADSDTQAVRISGLLTGGSGGPSRPPGRGLLHMGAKPPVSVVSAPFSGGFSLPDIKFMLVQENEIFGRRQRRPASLKTARSAALDTFVDLEPGDYVVHVNYGIGRFKGIDRIKALGHERDYVKLEYADEETVFVPIEQVNLVQRYIGNQGAPPRLDTLGSKSWETRKNRVKKSVEDIAERLIALYSKRRQAPGFAFPKDTEWQTMFEASFPFEETEDQLRCVEEIKADMESDHPMDRLVCGDVGYGKTEVAVRACFKAVMGGRQAAFLAPTTILAEQHYETFKERFSAFPVRVAMLSRFVEGRQVRKILADLKSGEVDLLVGTHRIIQKDVAFKNLGLLVIDEEQRFGVKDKERLKELKTNVDCLTLSATPIPRTLHMSLLKIRDMSLLTTPPHNRHPIETVIEEWDEERVAQAIRREAARGGQVFYLHNRVESLVETRLRVEHLVPELLVETAHGQMDAQDLEDVMRRFIHGGFHVLVSTTIIENGIDIPNVNTIIIDRADMYGVSQLYQLRGRVGRSDRVAYAYLFYPKDRALSEVAMKRLQVISDFTELGSGFKIAMKDMEIRGAGNLLGREQSGDIYSVGFDMYLRLLDEAVRRQEDASYEAEVETMLELEYSGFIPDSYIEGAQEKMEVYKRIASIRTKEELERVYAELVDRYGPPPDEAASLLALAEIRIICRELAVASLRERGGVVRAEFGKVSRVKVDRLVRLMKESGGKVRLDPEAPNVVVFAVGAISLREKSEYLREKLAALT